MASVDIHKRCHAQQCKKKYGGMIMAFIDRPYQRGFLRCNECKVYYHNTMIKTRNEKRQPLCPCCKCILRCSPKNRQRFKNWKVEIDDKRIELTPEEMEMVARQ